MWLVPHPGDVGSEISRWPASTATAVFLLWPGDLWFYVGNQLVGLLVEESFWLGLGVGFWGCEGSWKNNTSFFKNKSKAGKIWCNLSKKKTHKGKYEENTHFWFWFSFSTFGKELALTWNLQQTQFSNFIALFVIKLFSSFFQLIHACLRSHWKVMSYGDKATA